MLGAATKYEGPDKWQVGITWRYQKSDRHFRGKEEEADRQAEGSEVINRVHQAELSVRYRYDDRWSISLGVPYLMATRSSPVRNEDDVVFERSTSQSRGVGDITLVGRRWMLDPEHHTSANFSLGLGVKIPTGDNNVVDTRTRYDEDTGETFNAIETNDQSIQPGDGGFGFIIDAQGYYRFARDRAAAYATLTYLVNPAEKNGVKTYRGRESESVMSVADQYLYRLGMSFYPGKGIGLSLGGRMEGVPVEDLVGGSEGFRRPGYAISVEPGISYTRGAHTWSLAIPVAVERNRQRSVPDMEDPGRIGDAAFADYVILAGYWRKF